MHRNLPALACALALVPACTKEPVIVEAGLGSPCTRNADCASPYICLDARCVPTPLGCQPGEKRCNGDSVEECEETGTSFELVEQCATGCEAAECREAVCTPGTRRCSDSALTACLPNGTGYAFVQFCENDCADGECEPPPQACVPAARRCNGLALEACVPSGLGWSFLQFCDYACTDGACTPQPATCTPGASRCNGRAVETCTPDGRGFAFVRYCGTECDDGACVAATCRPFETRCASPDSLETCSAEGLAWTAEPCGEARACERGRCEPTVCAPGALRCGGREVESCNALGTRWESRGACAHGCSDGACLDAVCVPGARRCNDRAVEACLPDASGHAFLQYCPTNCLAGACTTAVCRPSETRCADTGTLETCAGDGGGWMPASCLETESCDRGACRPRACQPAELRCAGRVLETCSALGTEWTATETCQFTCDSGACTPAACTPTSRRCTGNAVEQCTPDASGWAFVEFCADTCVDGACPPPICVPLRRRCTGRDVQVCNGTGTAWVNVETCTDVCSDGLCGTTVQLCVPGARRCNGPDVQTCNPDGRAWTSLETCTAECDQGACRGVACRAFTLSATPATLPADGLSTTLVTSGLVTDRNGVPVPDGTLFTVTAGSGALASTDADPLALGHQVRSLAGRLKFTVRAPAAAGALSVTAAFKDSTLCTGATTITASNPAGRMLFAEDFSGLERRDPVATTATWDTAQQHVRSLSYDPALGVNTGTGRDGDLSVSSGQTFNLQTSTRPGLTAPDVAVHTVTFIDTRYGNDFVFVDPPANATLAPGDEVVLVNAQGGHCGAGNTCPNDPGWASQVGTYEFLTVRLARPDGLVFFTTQVRNSYSDGGNADLRGQKIFVQRVPNYDRVTVDGTLTTEPWTPAARKTGMIVLRSRRGVTVNAPAGRIDVTGLGYRGGRSDKVGTGVASKVTNSGWTGSSIDSRFVQQSGESFGGELAVYGTSAWFGGGGGAGLFGCWAPGVPLRSMAGGGGGYATSGLRSFVPADNSAPWGDTGHGGTYGDANLPRLFLGSGAGASAAQQNTCTWNNGNGGSCWERNNGTQCGIDSYCVQYNCCNCGGHCLVANCGGNVNVELPGGRGGGLIAMWTHDLIVAGGGIVANGTKPQPAYNGGSGGSILIHANSATVGGNLVTALGAYASSYTVPSGQRPPGDGRVAINYFDFALTGTTNPPAWTNLLGVFRKNMAQSFGVDSIDGPRVITAVKLAATNLKTAGGDVTFYVSTDGGRTWLPAAAVGSDVSIPQAARGADLRWRAEFRPLSLDPLSIDGLVLDFAVQ